MGVVTVWVEVDRGGFRQSQPNASRKHLLCPRHLERFGAGLGSALLTMPRDGERGREVLSTGCLPPERRKEGIHGPKNWESLITENK